MYWGQEQNNGVRKEGRDVSSPAIRATKISAHVDDNNVAQMSRRLNGHIYSHTPSALNAGVKRSLNVATWRRERSD